MGGKCQNDGFTYERGDRSAIRGTIVQVLVVIDTSEPDNGVYEGLLLGSAIHSIDDN